MLANLHTLFTADTVGRVLHIDMLVETQHVDFAEHVFWAVVVTLPTGFAQMGVNSDVIGTKLLHLLFFYILLTESTGLLA